MRAMTTKEIQDVGFEVLKHIDSFCKEHGIQYFLDSGTLLGAARHEGFIPWDDDIDIRMPRPDYERFIREFIDSDKFKLYSPSRGNSYLTYARVCEMQATFFKQTSPWTDESPGLGVDVFPLDGASDSLDEYLALAPKVCKAISQVYWLRSLQNFRRKFRGDVYGFLKDTVHCVVEGLAKLNLRYLLKRSIRKVEHLRQIYKYGQTMHCFSSILTMTERGRWETEWFSDVVYLNLCGEKFPAPIGWEQRLTAEYGDWRTPPPESERIGHAAYQTMYWRDK